MARECGKNITECRAEVVEGLHMVQYVFGKGREGVYGEGGIDYPDNFRRYVIFGRAAAMAAAELIHPDVVHAHDHSAGRRQMGAGKQHVVAERDRHAAQRAAGGDGAEDVVPVDRDRIGDRARLPVNGLQLFGARRRGGGKRAAIGAKDRGHVVVAHKPIHRHTCLFRCRGVDHLQSHVGPRDPERSLHPRKLPLSTLGLRAAQRVDRTQHQLVTRRSGFTACGREQENQRGQREATGHAASLWG